MNDVDYSNLAGYIESIFRRYDLKPGLVLDLGCGTGSLCIELSKKGYEMIGIDLSLDMLACARQKALECEEDILFLNQDITNFELYGTVGAVVSLMDTINYITNKRSLERTFKLVKNYLDPGGIFIFDINTAYKFENVLADNVFYDIGDDVSYIWKNAYNRKSKICRFDLTFFVREGGLYRKFDEVHSERCYSIDELKEMIAASGLDVLDVFDDKTFNAPKKNSERVFFICRKGIDEGRGE
ncbi:MAG TPA: class I SAM-dependent methyltransferase [Clostridiaceae bacterium]|nr:class I SAM-dependent methyltransferase [Clostridiaceae bacterium]